MRTRAAAMLVVLGACQPGETPWTWSLPAHVGPPHVPADNPMTVDKVVLGEALFHTTLLSADGETSCASCHLDTMAFTDGQAVSQGAFGERGTRSAQPLANVAWYATYTWANPILDSLEDQALVPLFLDHPLEMGAHLVLEEALAAFETDPEWRALFQQAFPGEDAPFEVGHIAAALASFQRSLVYLDSPYDRWVQGDDHALWASARRGFDLFHSDRLQCGTCHEGHLQTRSYREAGEVPPQLGFANTGLYNLDGDGGYPWPNVGLYEFTYDPADMGAHRVPSLRNVALTAPYMHDGSIPTLEAVLDHYAAGGRTLHEGRHAGVGADNPHKSALVRGFELTGAEREDLMAFLQALTDDQLAELAAVSVDAAVSVESAVSAD